MKILILLKKYEGGVGNANRRLSRVLEKQGHKVVIVSREGDLESFALRNSIKNLRKYVKKEGKNYDVIYTQDWSLALPLLVPFPLCWKKHFCCFCGNQEGKTKFLQDCIGRLFGKKLVVVSDSIKKRFPKSKLIYRGINYEEFKPLGKKRSCLGWVKKETELVNEDFILSLARNVGLIPLVAKKIPSNKMNEFYNRCKVFVSLPPFGAGMNNVWVEAMAAGVPIIIGNGNGLGKKWPYLKVVGKKNLMEECKKIIENPTQVNYIQWLKDNRISWQHSARELEKHFISLKGELLVTSV